MPQSKDTDWLDGYKNKTHICCLQEIHFRSKDTETLKWKDRKKIFHENGNKKKSGAAIFISDKIDFKTKTRSRDKEAYYIMNKGSIQEEYITMEIMV